MPRRLRDRLLRLLLWANLLLLLPFQRTKWGSTRAAWVVLILFFDAFAYGDGRVVSGSP